MNLQKAIEIGTIYRSQFHPNTDFDYAQAVSLLIEAGKRLQDLRADALLLRSELLPNETKD